MAAHAHPAPAPAPAPATTHRRTIAWSTVADSATYWLGTASIYVGYGFLWFYSAKEKLFDQGGTMPAGVAKQFSGHFVDSFPGLNASWLLLGLLEALAFVVIVASLALGEFLPHRRKPVLLAGLALSMLTFAVMSFAQNMIGGFETVASLFTYMGVTAVFYALFRLVAPFNGDVRR
jgi:hypothetical protein